MVEYKICSKCKKGKMSIKNYGNSTVECNNPFCNMSIDCDENGIRNIQSIKMVRTIYTKIVGVTFNNENGENRQEIIKTLKNKQQLKIIAEPTNPYDKNCQKVMTEDNRQIGNIKRDLAYDINKGRQKGQNYKAEIIAITGGEEEKNYGVNIMIIIE